LLVFVNIIFSQIFKKLKILVHSSCISSQQKTLTEKKKEIYYFFSVIFKKKKKYIKKNSLLNKNQWITKILSPTIKSFLVNGIEHYQRIGGCEF
jgi:hypothetical protein